MKNFFIFFNRPQHQSATNAASQWRFGWTLREAKAASDRPGNIGLYGSLVDDRRHSR